MAQKQQEQQQQDSSDEQGEQDRGLVSQVGPVQVDWARTAGYFGGIAAAVALEMIEWPVALFVAAVPFVKLFNQPKAPFPVRLVSHVYQGASIPVGGGAESTIRLPSSKGEQSQQEGKSDGKSEEQAEHAGGQRRGRSRAKEAS
jgi:hypothetical protein